MSKIMKVGAARRPETVLILAAGAGIRLFPNSSLPKPLAPILGLTMAERVVRTLREAVGVRRFVVTLGHEHETVAGHFRSVARRNNVDVEFVRAADWEKGNGASTLAASDVIGDAPFLLSMCDHLYDHALPAKLIEREPVRGEMFLAVDFDKTACLDIDDVTKVKTNGTHIAAISKNLTDWDAADTGVMYCTSGLFDGLRDAANAFGHGLSDGLAMLSRKRRAKTVDVTGCWWADMDTPEAIQSAEHLLTSGIRLTG